MKEVAESGNGLGFEPDTQTLEAKHPKFSDLLSFFIQRFHISKNQLASRIHNDPSYITRMANGDREPPRRHVIEALARELRLNSEEKGSLFVSAEYAPPALVESGWDPVHEAVTSVLTDPTLSPEEKDDYRMVIVAISNHWLTGKLI